MHPTYRRIAIAAFAALAGLCFALVAPAVITPLVAPPMNVAISFDDFFEAYNRLERAKSISNGLWLTGMAVTAIGALYGLAVAVFSKPTLSSSPSSSPL